MDEKEQGRHEIERLLRRAEELGHDSRRVARALNHSPAPRVEYQPTMKFAEQQSWFGVRVARRLARRSASSGD